MVGTWQGWLHRLNPSTYVRRPSLILINGLAEQGESWYRSQHFWRRTFDVHLPNILVYDGAALHRRIDAGLPISVDYLVEQLHLYLDAFVQTPPYHFAASSLGGKIAVEYAVRYPEDVNRMVLICPSGLGDEERLPVIEGLRHNNVPGLLESVFYDPRAIDLSMLAYYRRQFNSRRWRTGLLRTIRGTMEHSVRDRLSEVMAPTLLISGREDRIVDTNHAARCAHLLPRGRFHVLPQCGHAPQLEKPGIINRMVVDFLTSPEATLGLRERTREHVVQ